MKNNKPSHVVLFWTVILCFFLTAMNFGKENYRNSQLDAAFKLDVNGRYITVYDGRTFIISTDEGGRIIRDEAVNHKAAYSVMIRDQWCREAEIKSMKDYIRRIDEFIKLEGMAQIALFFRDAASKIMVDVGVAYLKGDPSEFTRQVAVRTLRQAGKNALKETVIDMGKNPDNYLRAMAIGMLKKTRDELKAIRELAQDYAERAKLNVEDLERFDARVRRAYVQVVPAMQLIQDLRPSGSAASQLRDVAAVMSDRLKAQIPGGFESLSTSAKREILVKMGVTLDKLYSLYRPYRNFQREMEEFQEKSGRGDQARRENAIAKVRAGQAETRGYSKFRSDRIVMMKSYNYPDYYIGHPSRLGKIIRHSRSNKKKLTTYRLVPGLANKNCVSFESVDRPGYFLRHSNYRIRLNRNDGSRLFRKDATFRLRRGLYRSSWASFESYNYPGHYIRHYEYKLYIRKDKGSLFRKDATFKIIDTKMPD